MHVEKAKIMLDIHGKPLVVCMRAQITTRKLGVELHNDQWSNQPSSRLNTSKIMLYTDFLSEDSLFWLHLNLEYGLKTPIKDDLDL